MLAEDNKLNLKYKKLSKTSHKDIVFFYGSKKFILDLLPKNTFLDFGTLWMEWLIISLSDKNKKQNLKNKL